MTGLLPLLAMSARIAAWSGAADSGMVGRG